MRCPFKGPVFVRHDSFGTIGDPQEPPDVNHVFYVCEDGGAEIAGFEGGHECAEWLRDAINEKLARESAQGEK